MVDRELNRIDVKYPADDKPLVIVHIVVQCLVFISIVTPEHFSQ